MSATADIRGSSPSSIATSARAIAALMPAVIISYSGLIDPLINFDLASGEHFGGVVLGGESKNKTLTRIIIPVFLLVALALAAYARPNIPRRLRILVLPALILLSVAFLSALWGRGPMRTLTLASYQLFLFTSLLIFTAVAADPKRILQYVLLAFALITAANLATVILRPPGPIGHQGIYEYKNTLGAAGGCAFLFGFFHLFQGRLFWRATALFTTLGAIVITLASESKTALALMITAPALATGIYLFSRLLALGPILAGALLLALTGTAIVAVCAMVGASLDDVLLATYGDTTFTGRTGVWEFAYDYVRQSPLLGNGYRTFWELGSASPKHRSEVEFIRTIGSAHNGYLDITLSVGLVGLFFLLVFALTAFSIAGRADLQPPHRSLLYLAVIIFILGRNIMESVLLWSTFFDNLCFLLAGFLACYRDVPPNRLVVRRFGAQDGVVA